MEIREIQTNKKQVVHAVTDIHLATFRGFFLTFMGRGFLRQMYSAYCAHEASGLLVAFEDEVPVGFLAYSEDMSGLYKYMIKSRLIPFAWYSAGAFFRKPAVFMRLVRAFLKPAEAEREEKYVELASIGVSPNAKKMGVGTALINTLKSKVDFDKFEYITLDTDEVNNDAANLFYIKNGFKEARRFQTHEGRKMIEYRFHGKERSSKNENLEAALYTQHN